MSEEQTKDTSVCIGRYYAEPHEETPNEQRVRRALKLLMLVEDLVPEGVAVAIRGNRATFRAERDGKAHELDVTSKEGTHVLDCGMAAVSLYVAADVCRRFVAGEE